MRRTKLASLLLFVPFIVLASPSHAQEGDLDELLRRGTLGSVSPETRSQAEAKPPKTDDQQELSVFHHKRGMANLQLGNYPHAVEDLRLALQHNQPNRFTSQGWGDRFRIQHMLN